MSINFVPGFNISFLINIEDNKLAFKDAIDNIYHGYRRCYSKHPFDEINITDEDKKILKQKYINYFEESVKADQFFDKSTLVLNNKDFRSGQGEEYFSEMIKNYGEEEFYDYLYKCNFIKSHLNHESPFEHGSLCVSIENVSRSFTHQWVRSRLASHSQASQRYIGEKSGNIDIILPTKVADNPAAVEIINKYFSQLPDVIKQLSDVGIRNEDIRCVFPNAIATSIISTMNFREWKHVFELRISSHAQKEIREVSYSVWEFLNSHIPFVWLNTWERVTK